jgi:hypothetical protein
MIRYTVLIYFLAGALISCHEKKSNPVPVIATAKTDSFFPVTSFLEGQMNLLDSLQLSPMHITTFKDRNDSVWVKREELRPLLQSFLSPEITERNFTTLFRETKFIDQTLNAVTFTYDPVQHLPDSVTLRHWDVYVNPETGHVTKVYIVKQTKEQGKRYTYQLIWQTGKWAKITIIQNNSDGTDLLLKADKFIWNFEDI